MTEHTKENMILRTVYLPSDLDSRLRSLAFTRGVSKGELIRDLINNGLADREAAGERTLAQKVSALAAKGKGLAKASRAITKQAPKRPEPRRASKRTSAKGVEAFPG
jgi:Ribbon-helix-helix protein, copG family